MEDFDLYDVFTGIKLKPNDFVYKNILFHINIICKTECFVSNEIIEFSMMVRLMFHQYFNYPVLSSMHCPSPKSQTNVIEKPK